MHFLSDLIGIKAFCHTTLSSSFYFFSFYLPSAVPRDYLIFSLIWKHLSSDSVPLSFDTVVPAAKSLPLLENDFLEKFKIYVLLDKHFI